MPSHGAEATQCGAVHQLGCHGHGAAAVDAARTAAVHPDRREPPPPPYNHLSNYRVRRASHSKATHVAAAARCTAAPSFSAGSPSTRPSTPPSPCGPCGTRKLPRRTPSQMPGGPSSQPALKGLNPVRPPRAAPAAGPTHTTAGQTGLAGNGRPRKQTTNAALVCCCSDRRNGHKNGGK